MAAFFIDLDGTVLVWGMNEFLPGALKMLKDLRENGHQIIFTTKRGDLQGHSERSPMHPKNTERFLKESGIEYDYILYDIDSPRVVVNDHGCHAINHRSNFSVDYDFQDVLKDKSNYGK